MLPHGMETLWDLCPNSSLSPCHLPPSHSSQFTLKLGSSTGPTTLQAQALCFSLKFLICKVAITLPVGEVYWET